MLNIWGVNMDSWITIFRMQLLVDNDIVAPGYTTVFLCNFTAHRMEKAKVHDCESAVFRWEVSMMSISLGNLL